MRAILVILLLCSLPVSGQRFFNLTNDEVRIDSVLPYFGHSIPLAGNHADSIYEVTILYPEFIDMSNHDIEQYRKIAGEALPELPEVNQQILVSRRKATLSIGFVPLVFREGRYQILASFMLRVKATPKASSAQAKTRQTRAANGTLETEPDKRYAGHSVLSSGRWAKIGVMESGVFELTHDLIRQAGFSQLSRVKVYGYGGNLQPETLSGDYLTATDDLKEVVQCAVGNRRLFYAKGPVSWETKESTTRTRNPYSDYGYYFITETDEETQTVDSATFVSTFYPSVDDFHVLHESDGYAWFQGGRNLYEYTPVNSGSSKTYTLTSPVAGTPAKLSVTVSAGVNSKVSVSCNGQELGTISTNLLTYEKGHATNQVYQLSEVRATNEVTLTTLSGGPVRLDFISLTLSEPKPAPNLQKDRFAVPKYIYNITHQDLHADQAVDMVMIIPTSQKLRSQAERLAQFHRDYDHLRVRVVPADELYNEFSSGTPDATAYKRYLKMLYDRAGTNEADLPRFLLLFGDCAWDNRMKTNDWRQASPDDYLLCYESENSFSEAYSYVSDDFFCMLDDDEALTLNLYSSERTQGQADVAVGRFPVVTENDAKVMVDKTIAYARNANAGAWQNTLVFMGDDGTDAESNPNVHMRDVNDAADETAQLHPGYLIKKVMWDAYKLETSSTGNAYPEVVKTVKQFQQQGALIMDYAGHGKADQLSHENVLKLSDFEQFSHTNLPLWITAACTVMPFDGSTPTIGETAVLNGKGGAVAFYGTAREVFVDKNKTMNMAFLRHVLSFNSNGKPTTLGEAQMRTKNWLIQESKDRTVNMLQYHLLGDPALALNIPTGTIIIDSIDGIKANGTASQQIQLKAGSIARIVGHVADVPDFNGIVSATVRDSEETITCKRNSPSNEVAFTYSDRTKTLYSGSDSIRNGRFEFTFIVPKDINYTDSPGLINVHAVNNERTLAAHGANNNFIIGGTAAMSNDSIGPSIYCYLNSPSFVNGGNVNTTPFFVAEITDKDGINATGNGIGHDLELIIDGEMSKTYVLNDYFQYDFGSYTTGSTYYNIPELEPGPHTLLFRAWDVLNNPSTAQLTFNVVKSLTPTFFSVACTQNPARTATSFIINHDRTGTTMDVELDIFDMSGRQLWRHEESGVPTSSAYTVNWDLTVDGGRRMQTGVYLYRVSIATDGSKKVSKAKKLIIL